MGRKDRTEEKERLMEEVLGKNRTSTFDSVDARSYLENRLDTMKNADDAMSELNKILTKQKETLEDMGKQLGTTDEDMDKLQKEIEADYGFKLDPSKEPHKKEKVDKKIFDDIYTNITSKIMGQKDALTQLMIAFRRPFVMGEEEGRAKNVILISGPDGSGRHSCISSVARGLYEKQVFISPEVYTIDLSLYTSSSQEQVFLQDLYKALHAKGSVVCFENFEVGYAPYLRMIDNLVCEGKVMLNKRYIESSGQLVEATSGLVNNAVDSLNANGKYLVFITTNKISKVVDSFGASFMDHVLDQIELKPLDDKSVKEIVAQKLQGLVEKIKTNLDLDTEIDPKISVWVKDHYNKEVGVEGIEQLVDNFYISISQIVLEKNVKETSVVKLLVEEEKPIVKIGHFNASLVKEDTSDEELIAINKELDEVVGLNQVKDYVRSLQSHIKVQELRRQQGMKTSEVSKHMIFTGNPGTGKTTIARLISRYMKAIGALSQGQLVEVTRADLVGQYVGHTAPLTMSVIKSAIGGVLFVDEAYSLYRGKDDSFGLEAIDTLVKAMEDNREDLIVILAGYSKEMSTFLEANSGLKSRFPNVIHFPDYTGEELEKIAIHIAKGKDYKIDEACIEPLIEYFTKVQATNARESGNGRLARNLVEEAILTQSKRLLANPNDPIDVLKLEDFDLVVKVNPDTEA